MTKLTLTTVGSTLTNTAATQINTNNAAIVTAVENTLSRDGSAPNQMNADIDMNGNDLLNVSRASVESLFIDGEGVQSVNIATALKISNNLSDVDNVTASRTNLGLTDTATATSTAFGKSLIDDATASDAQTTLGISTFVKTILDDVDAAAVRTTIGLGTMATQAASGVAITGGSVTGITDLAVADGGTGASTAAGARTNLGLVVGTDVQAFDTDLAAIAALTSAADKLPYATGAGTWAMTDLSAFGRTLIDDAAAVNARSTLGLVIGTDVQAFRLVGSATYDPPSLADGAGTSTTVTVTGAALGDFAIPSFSLDLQGITVTAYVSSANTCTVRFQNESGGVLDLASGTLRVAVFK